MITMKEILEHNQKQKLEILLANVKHDIRQYEKANKKGEHERTLHDLKNKQTQIELKLYVAERKQAA
jgi:hypothetical protein